MLTRRLARGRGSRMSEWISVTERLPELETGALIYSPGLDACGFSEGVQIAILKEIFDDGRGYWESDTSGVSGYDYDTDRSTAITHWMPLPPPPSEVER